MTNKRKMTIQEIDKTMCDAGVDRLVGAIIRDAMNDLFVDVDRLKRSFQEADKAREEALLFFVSDDSLFKKTGIDFNYLLNYYPCSNKTIRKNAIRMTSTEQDRKTPLKMHTERYILNWCNIRDKELEDNQGLTEKWTDEDRNMLKAIIYHLKQYDILKNREAKRIIRLKAQEKKEHSKDAKD